MNRAVRTAACLALLVLALGGCVGPPQIGANREAFKAVDALYTAVSLKDATLLAQCAEELDVLSAAGALPADASRRLASIIAHAKDGSWEQA
jgi:hypothetical protein